MCGCKGMWNLFGPYKNLTLSILLILAIVIFSSDPRACSDYWTDGYRRVNLSSEFYWEHSDERLLFLTWHTPAQDDPGRNYLSLRRHTSTEDRNWGLYAGFDGYTACYMCELDLPLK